MNNHFYLSGTPLYNPNLKSRSITAENKKGLPGEGGKANNSRKGSPCLLNLKKGERYTFAEMDGPGVIRHIWITVDNTGPNKMRNLILRFYWDNQDTPSVEAPLTDFFGVSHGYIKHFESAYLSMPEGRGLNCFFPMPFRKKAKLVICNETGEDSGVFFYQVDYTLGDTISTDTPYFHAQFRREVETKLADDYVIVDGIKGFGRYIGANIGILDKFTGRDIWWGEGEVKIYLDNDTTYPTICGTGTEDYVGSAWGLGQFFAQDFGAPFIDGKFISFYRFHLKDPIYFSSHIKVTIQQIGFEGTEERADINGPLGEFVKKGYYRKDKPGGFFERVDDVCSTAYWYQSLPTNKFPPFPGRERRSVNLEYKP